MNDKPYRLLPGSIADRVVSYLRTFPPDIEKSSAEIALYLKMDTKSMGPSLGPAVRAGILNRRMGRSSAFWSLGARLAPTDDEIDAAVASADERSVHQASVDAFPSIFAYAKSREAAPFSLSVSTDGRLTIERYGRTVCELTDRERMMLLNAARHGVTHL